MLLSMVFVLVHSFLPSHASSRHHSPPTSTIQFSSIIQHAPGTHGTYSSEQDRLDHLHFHFYSGLVQTMHVGGHLDERMQSIQGGEGSSACMFSETTAEIRPVTVDGVFRVKLCYGAAVAVIDRTISRYFKHPVHPNASIPPLRLDVLSLDPSDIVVLIMPHIADMHFNPVAYIQVSLYEMDSDGLDALTDEQFIARLSEYLEERLRISGIAASFLLAQAVERPKGCMSFLDDFCTIL